MYVYVSSSNLLRDVRLKETIMISPSDVTILFDFTLFILLIFHLIQNKQEEPRLTTGFHY